VRRGFEGGNADQRGVQTERQPFGDAHADAERIEPSRTRGNPNGADILHRPSTSFELMIDFVEQ